MGFAIDIWQNPLDTLIRPRHAVVTRDKTYFAPLSGRPGGPNRAPDAPRRLPDPPRRPPGPPSRRPGPPNRRPDPPNRPPGPPNRPPDPPKRLPDLPKSAPGPLGIGPRALQIDARTLAMGHSWFHSDALRTSPATRKRCASVDICMYISIYCKRFANSACPHGPGVSW